MKLDQVSVYYVDYLDYIDGFKGLYRSQNVSNFVMLVCAVYCMSILHQ